MYKDREYPKKYRLANRATLSAGHRDWVNNNREKIRKTNLAWAAANPEKRNMSNRQSVLNQRLKLFGLTEAYLIEVLKRPCRFCNKEFLVKELTQSKKDWVFDHDHKTGMFRGIIHPNCNSGLGMLGDTKESLQVGLGYFPDPFNYEYDFDPEGC